MAEVPQRNLLGEIIERKIPRRVQAVSEGQITLDSFIERLSNPGVDVSIIRTPETAVSRRGRNRQQDYLIINRGTVDEIKLAGRYYTPEIGREAWTAPAERRDSYPKIAIQEGNIIFQVTNSDVWENGVRWAHVVVLNRVKTGKAPSIRGHGYMRWTDIRKK